MWKYQILTALKTKYARLGFSDSAFNGVADYLAKTVKEEAEVQAAVDGADGLLQAFNAEADRRVERHRKENADNKGNNKKGNKGNAADDDDDEDADDDDDAGTQQTTSRRNGKSKNEESNSEIAQLTKLLTKMQKANDARFDQLTTAVTATQKSTLAEKRVERFTAMVDKLSDADKTKALNDFKRIEATFKDEEEYESYMQEQDAYYKPIIQKATETNLTGFGGVQVPAGGQQQNGNAEPSADFKQFINERNAAQAAKTGVPVVKTA